MYCHDIIDVFVQKKKMKKRVQKKDKSVFELVLLDQVRVFQGSNVCGLEW
jgi:hypothetical protein